MARLFKRPSSDVYWADYRDAHNRRVRVSTKCRDHTAANLVLARWQREVELQRSGMPVISADHLKAPLSQHLSDWLETRRNRGRDERYLAGAKRELERMAERFHWHTLGDLTPEGIDRALNTLRRETTAKTVNNKRGYLSALVHWCVQNRRLGDNLLRTPWFETTDSTKRRALRLEEVHKLLTCPHLPLWRRIVYRALIGTGLRRSEASGLLVEHVRLDDAVPHLYVPAWLAKSGEEETIPLSAEMQRVFRRAIEDRTEGQAAFAKVPVARRFEMDLITAGIQPIDHRGRKAVLHSTRHTFVSLLAAEGASLPEIMEVARHRSQAETAGYLDAALLPKSATIARMPSLLPVVRVDRDVPSEKHTGTALDMAHPEIQGSIRDECRRQESNLHAHPQRPDAFWAECPCAVPYGAPRPFVLPDTTEGRSRVIDELRGGDCAVYVRGGAFIVIDIPKEPA